MNILMSNDDGIQSDGLMPLAQRLSEKHKVLVIAPESERSGFSHKLTMRSPIEIVRHVSDQTPEYYVINGTPADCIKFGVIHIKDFCPDLVIGGINRGPNLGTDIMYSGTCAVAREGVYEGIPSIALSMNDGRAYDYSYAIDFVFRNLETLAKMPCEDTFLNVNFPNCGVKAIQGVKYCGTGKLNYAEQIDVKGSHFVFSGNLQKETGDGEHTDIDYIRQNFITVTPVYTVRTNAERLEKIRKLPLQI